MALSLTLDASRLNFSASDAVSTALKRIGRTEDVKFSQDGKRLAICDYSNNRLMILDIESQKRGIKIKDYLEVSSEALKLPHGVCWIDESTLVVANRIGLVCVFQLPKTKPINRQVTLAPLASLSKADLPLLKKPGSVTATKLSKNLYEILVCSFPTHLVSRHVLSTGDGFRFSEHSIFLKGDVITPDGVVRSASGRLAAVSNHRGHHVSVFDTAAEFNSASLPIAKLEGPSFPHGLQFSKDEKFILVADAGQPFVHFFYNDGKGWSGTLQPVASLRILDDAAFMRGHVNNADGGSKGIGLDPANKILAVTCQEEPFAFYNVQALLATKTFPQYVHPNYPHLPAKPPKSLLLRAWKLCRRSFKRQFD